MKHNLIKHILVCLVLGLGGCTNEAVETENIELGLHLEEDADNIVSGSFADGESIVRFRAEVEGTRFSVEVESNGLTLVASMDDAGNLEHDGYVTHDGSATQLTEDDRKALVALYAALNELGPEATEPTVRLRRLVGYWSEQSSSKELGGSTFVGFRAHTSLCGVKGTFQTATHDDNIFANGSDATTFKALVNMQAASPCPEGTLFSTNNINYTCYEPNHDVNVEWGKGNCFGRCGSDCGADSQLTKDCLDHDSCVRFGHTIASIYCDDELSATLDDLVMAPDCY